MAETLFSHITKAESPLTTTLEGATAIEWEELMKETPLSDGDATPDADLIGVAGAISFRNIPTARTFLGNVKQDLVCTIMQKGQAVTNVATFANAKGLRIGRARVGSKLEQFAQTTVEFRADSLAIV